MQKYDRQGAILRLVQERALSTQSDVVEALREEGIEAVQATVSRDIHQLGLVKVQGAGGRLVYALPGRRRPRPAQRPDTAMSLTRNTGVASWSFAFELSSAMGFLFLRSSSARFGFTSSAAPTLRFFAANLIGPSITRLVRPHTLFSANPHLQQRRKHIHRMCKPQDCQRGL